MALNSPEWSAREQSETLTLTLSGDWAAPHNLPRPAELITATTMARQVIIDGSAIDQWDSGLISLILQTYRNSEERGISVTSKLPEGADQLLALAVAVPLEKGQHQARRQWLSAFNPLLLMEKVGASVADFLEFIGNLVVAAGKAATGQARFRISDTIGFCYQTGPNALPIITLTSLLVGMILGYLGAVQLQQFGAGVYVANLVTVGVLREMGALMTAIIIAGRTGAAYAAQLGTMRVNEEVDAIEILGISPTEFLVLPRVLAVTLMVPLLTLYANVLGILGGGIVASGMGVSPLQYWTQAEASLGLSHLTVGLVKALIFGVLIGIAGCRAGIESGRDSEGVGKATTTAVVVSLVYLILADASINLFCQLLGL